MAERLTVDQDVVGSTPISHPFFINRSLIIGGNKAVFMAAKSGVILLDVGLLH